MKRLLLTLLILLLLGAAIAKFFVFEIPTVTGNDMAPTLQAGDRLLAYRLDLQPRPGDLILFDHPTEGRLMIRRVIGVPGDRVAVRDETPVLNGKRLARKTEREVTLSDLLEGRRQEVKMKLIEESLGDRSYLLIKDPRRRSRDYPESKLENAFFVMADSRNHGTDSRNFGPVAAGRVRAVVTHRLSAGPGSLLGEGPRKGWSSLR